MTRLLNNLLMHTQSQQFEKPNNFKVFGSKNAWGQHISLMVDC
jgi:hypothetical protein